MNSFPFVSVLVVNFNGNRVVTDCLDSLAQQTYPSHRMEVILVDNASTDDSVQIVREQYPWVRLVVLPNNTGFAEGNNIALCKAQGEWIALLNSDAMAEPDWLAKSVATGMPNSNIGGITGQLVFRDRPELLNSTGLQLLPDGRGADRDYLRQIHDVHRATGEIFGGCGAALVLRRSMLERIGFFDSRLFMYYEDLDLAWRAQRAGWKFIYSPDIRVRHVFGASVGISSPRQVQFVERNRFLVNLQHAPLFVVAGTGLGMMTRCGRALFRCLTGNCNTTLRHVQAHVAAILSSCFNLPGFVSNRAILNAKHGSADRIYRRWSRSQ